MFIDRPVRSLPFITLRRRLSGKDAVSHGRQTRAMNTESACQVEAVRSMYLVGRRNYFERGGVLAV